MEAAGSAPELDAAPESVSPGEVAAFEFGDVGSPALDGEPCELADADAVAPVASAGEAVAAPFAFDVDAAPDIAVPGEAGFESAAGDPDPELDAGAPLAEVATAPPPDFVALTTVTGGALSKVTRSSVSPCNS